MPYRPTEKTEARKRETRERIVRTAHDLVARGGYGAASVSAVAAGAGVATGSVYRHFGSKADLFAEVFRRAAQHEVDAVSRASGCDRHATERMAAAVATFARRALRGRRLAWALIAEPVDPAVEAERLISRAAYRDAFARVLEGGIAAGELPPQDPTLAAAAIVGAIAEALVGPLAPTAAPGLDEDALVEGLVRFCLRSITEEEIDVRR